MLGSVLPSEKKMMEKKNQRRKGNPSCFRMAILVLFDLVVSGARGAAHQEIAPVNTAASAEAPVMQGFERQ